MPMNKIDFVIPWVDGSDPDWLREKARYSNNIHAGNEAERFREWDQLKYWFRGVEKFAPWVNKIYFVTCGHVPSWLNIEHPKLSVVRHEEYIPADYLPVFSANPIEVNLHRISDLSEHFVYFNDDMFIVDHISPEDFFVRGVPCGTAGLSIPMQVSHQFAGILLKDYGAINQHFSSRDVMKQHFWKFVNYKYGLKRNLQTLLLMPYCTSHFPGFYNAHGPNAFLKSTFCEVWEKNEDVLHTTCTHRFRSFDDVNQYLFLWWQWCKGHISPRNTFKFVTYLSVLFPDSVIAETITEQKTPIIVINDDWVDNFEQKKAAINGALDKILGEKSSFEK